MHARIYTYKAGEINFSSRPLFYDAENCTAAGWGVATRESRRVHWRFRRLFTVHNTLCQRRSNRTIGRHWKYVAVVFAHKKMKNLVIYSSKAFVNNVNIARSAPISYNILTYYCNNKIQKNYYVSVRALFQRVPTKTQHLT